VPLFINIDYPPDAVDLVMSFDSRYFDLTEAAAFAGTVEAAAVETALSPQAPVLHDERIQLPV
jgi:hypothetical protein